MNEPEAGYLEFAFALCHEKKIVYAERMPQLARELEAERGVRGVGDLQGADLFALRPVYPEFQPRPVLRFDIAADRYLETDFPHAQVHLPESQEGAFFHPVGDRILRRGAGKQLASCGQRKET